jgi:type IV pilus assembly protein PilX
MKSIQLIAPPSRQRGVTLIVALIFLAILMLLGVTIAQTSSMEERMAGNTRDRDLALQSAEAALKAADAALKALPKDPGPGPNMGKITTAFDGSTVGYVAYNPANASDAAYWSAYDWAGASHSAGTSLWKVAAQPRYVIEKLPDSVNTQRFRVTARGVGSSASTVVILQAGYENN